MIDEIMKHPDMEPFTIVMPQGTPRLGGNFRLLADGTWELFTSEQVALAVRMAMMELSESPMFRTTIENGKLGEEIRSMAAQLTPEPRDEYRTDKFYQTT
jgi:hypothetical protein